MGMFDRVYCDLPMPDGYVSSDGFQTKDLECSLATYYIREDGIYKSELHCEEDNAPVRLDEFHGFLHFYDYFDGNMHDYKAKFTDGICMGIRKWTAKENQW